MKNYSKQKLNIFHDITCSFAKKISENINISYSKKEVFAYEKIPLSIKK